MPRRTEPNRESADWAAGYQDALSDVEEGEAVGPWVRALVRHHDELADAVTVWAPSAHERVAIAQALQLLAERIVS